MKKIGSLFTGIGAFEEALKQCKINFASIFSCDNGERYLDLSSDNFKFLKDNLDKVKIQNKIEKHYNSLKQKNFVKESFELNHKTKKWFNDIRFMSAKKYESNLDLIVGGSPCQSFSHIGKRGGIDDARGTLFYDYIRIIKESKPKYFIYENVMGIKTIDDGRTWDVMLKMFSNLGYKFKVFQLNAKDFNLPQSRNRIFVVGTNLKNAELGEPKKIKLQKTTEDYLEDSSCIDEKYFLGKKGFEFVTNVKYKNRAKVNSKIIMCQKANQQFNWNGDFVFYKTNQFKKHKRIWTGKFKGEIGCIRKMTPKETIKLMGFKDFTISNSIPDQQLYRQSGNSIAVPVLKSIFKEVIGW